MLTRTNSNNPNEMQYNTEYAANICVVCDIFIIVIEPIEWVSKEQLLKYNDCLGVEKYVSFFQ